MPFKCPHCSVLIHPVFTGLVTDNSHSPNIINYYESYESSDLPKRHNWFLFYTQCLSCRMPIVKVRDVFVVEKSDNRYDDEQDTQDFIIYPNNKLNISLPPEVPKKYRNYFKEACSVLNDSPAASAALSRRILQLLLVEKAGVKDNGNLKSMIDEVVNSGLLPSYLAEDIDKVKDIGNYAVHPNKSTNPNEIIDVEPGEAEWSLDILEGLFDFYFVQPIKAQKRRDEWDKKIKGNK